MMPMVLLYAAHAAGNFINFASRLEINKHRPNIEQQMLNQIDE